MVTLGEVTQDKKMSRCHLPRVVYHQGHNVYLDNMEPRLTLAEPGPAHPPSHVTVYT